MREVAPERVQKWHHALELQGYVISPGQFLILELRILTPAHDPASVRGKGILNSRIKNGQTQ
jgi:hypothetical protein